MAEGENKTQGISALLPLKVGNMGEVVAKTGFPHIKTMAKFILSEKGKLRKSDDVELAEKLVETKQKKGHWDVIDEMVKAWLARSPEEVQALKIEVEDHRNLLVDKKYGQTLQGRDMERRFTLVFPITLQLMIRSLYKAEELPFDRPFYQEFAQRYPAFKVAQEV